MISDLLTYGLPALIAAVAGAAAGGLAAWKLRSRPDPGTELDLVEADGDPFIDAEIDRASVHWAESHNHPPEAAGLMAERLKTLHRIGHRKGWVQ
jgi:hypothetical protein